MRPIKGTVTDPVALRRALGGKKPEQENPLAEALRRAQKGKDRAIRLFQETKDSLNRLGEELRNEKARADYWEQRYHEAVEADEGYPGIAHDYLQLQNEIEDLRRQLKAFEAAGSAIERAVMKTFDNLRAEIAEKDAVIRALVAEGD